MSDNGEKLIIAQEEPKDDKGILKCYLNDSGQIVIDVNPKSTEANLILAKYWINKHIDGLIMNNHIRLLQEQKEAAIQANQIMNRIRGE